jgi:DNA repair protein RadC
MTDPDEKIRERQHTAAEAVATYGADVLLDEVLRAKRPRPGRRLAAAADVYSYLRARLALLPVEEFWAIALDVRHRVIAELMVARGSLTGVDVHPRDVFRPLIALGAAAVICAHNHPSGDCTPSRQDLDLTTRLRATGELVGITLLDHVVVATEGYASIADRNWA